MRVSPRRVPATFVTIFLLTMPGMASAGELQVWPVPGLFGLDQTNCNRRADASPEYDSAKVHRDLCALFADPETLRVSYGELFVDQVAKAFPDFVTKPAQGVSSGAAVSQRLSNTLIASLHMSRADIWTVDKHTGASEVFLPFTLTLNLTNAVSGEVMFTETASVIPESTFSSKDVAGPSRKELPAQIRSAIAQLVRASADKFKPYPLEATVRGKIGDDFLIDKGRSAGLRIGDHIGPDARVVYADAGYAFIKPVLGDFKTGENVSREVAAPAEYLAKPSAVILPAAMPKGMPKAYITQIFEELLGAQGVFSTMPVNQSFPRLRDLATSAVGMPSSVTAQRASPDYLVHLDVYALPHSEVGTNVAGVKVHTFEANATASIIDRSGRVVFATVASDRIQDQVVGGVGFSLEQRQDTVTKNALLKLAQRIAAQFKPQNLRLALTEQGKGASASDPSGALSLGAGGLVVRKAGRFSGIEDDVWAPVGNFEVISIDGAKATLQSQDPLAPKVRKDDIFVYDGGALATQTRRSFTLCTGDLAPDSQSRDLSSEPTIRGIGFALFAQSFPAPAYLNDMPAIGLDRLSQFPGLQKFGVVKSRGEDLCIRPILRLANLGTAQVKGGLVASKYALTMGYTIHRGGEKLSGSGLRVEMTSGGFQPGTDPAEISISNDRDAIAQFTTMVSGALKTIEMPK